MDADETAIHGTDPAVFDTDGDGLCDGQELGVTNATAPSGTDLSVFVEDIDPASTTDPLQADTDGGGVDDGQEDQDRDGYFDPLDETDPRASLDDARAMYVEDLVIGQRFGVHIRNGAGDYVRVFYSLTGGQTSWYQAGIFGIYLDLTHHNPGSSGPPEFAINADVVLDADGNGDILGPRVPPTAPLGVPVWLQGVEVDASSGSPIIRATTAVEKRTVQ